MRHAYLILAHGNFHILERQLRFLDSENADFYIHIDAKVPDFDFDRFAAVPKKSNVYYVNRFNIHWGDVSMIQAEYALLEAAVPGSYGYYHLLSGVDVPVKSREYIESYFGCDNVNYVNFNDAIISDHYLDRVKYYYPLQNRDIRNRYARSAVRAFSAFVQRVWGTDRTRKYPEMEFQKGTQWFSITHEFAEYVLSQKELAMQIFRQSCCSDEMLVQTLLINSPYKDTVSPNNFRNDHACCLRYIDWNRGKPYTFTDDDFEELIHTPENILFARKFTCSAEKHVADRVFDFFEK